MEEILALVPEEKQGEAKLLLQTYVKADSKDSVISAMEANPVLKSVRDSIISKTTAAYEQRFIEEKLPGFVEQEIKRRNPAKSQVEIELEAIKTELETTKRQAKQKELLAKAVEVAKNDGLPFGSDILNRFISDDEESTLENIKALSGIYKNSLEAAINQEKEKRLGNAGKPTDGKSLAKTISKAEFDLLSPAEKLEKINAGIRPVEE